MMLLSYSETCTAAGMGIHSDHEFLAIDYNTNSADDCETLCAETQSCNYWWHVKNRCNMYTLMYDLVPCAGGCTAGPVSCKLHGLGFLKALLKPLLEGKARSCNLRYVDGDFSWPEHIVNVCALHSS